MAHFDDTVGKTLKAYGMSGFPTGEGVHATGDLPSRHHDDLMVLEPKIKTARPPFFKVVMLNDDFTPMEFVVEVLKTIFRHAHEDAVAIMVQIHQKGAGVCGVFTRDVAETKAEIVIGLARQNEYPLQCVLEKE
ncbi:MAG: ATP-dependent Clp protease adapter ClpS [Rickettsiales bacterium]